MTPHFSDDHLTVYAGDVRDVLPTLPAGSVHCVVTSPPYWGLRDYGTAAWEGGDPECQHVERRGGHLAESVASTRGGAHKVAEAQGLSYRDTCGKCGARRVDDQIGLEATPEAYVESMVAVFREVRRVLRADGTVWLNLGSSYAGSGMGGGGSFASERPGWRDGADASGRTPSLPPSRALAYGSDGTGPQGSTDLGSACLDLCDGCRAALSSRTTGTPRPTLAALSLRSPTGRDSEPPGSAPASPDASPLGALASTTPRSETPLRATCSHCGNCGACLSVLGSSSRDARLCVRNSWLNYTTFKPKDLIPIPWLVALALQADGWYLRRDVIWAKPNPMPESVTDRPTSSHEYVFLLTKSPRYYYDADAVKEPAIGANEHDLTGGGKRWPGIGPKHGMTDRHKSDYEPMVVNPARNLRSVWTIATQPYPGAHFATFPEKLVEPCVKAGTSERGVCPECGAPWVRVVERTPTPRDLTDHRGRSNHHDGAGRNDGDQTWSGQEHNRWKAEHPDVTTGWRPSCAHDAEPVPATVLDPFAGSGTVGRVANRLGRRAVLIDLSADYIDQAMLRNAQAPLGLGA